MLVYVDCCIVFEDGLVDGDWCVLFVNCDNGIKFYCDDDLCGGIVVDVLLDVFQGLCLSVCQVYMIIQKGCCMCVGQYML